MTSHRPLVSIILPTYNREAFLREAVTSVLAQTFRDWELLVIDDGSTDGTAAYLRGLTDGRLRVLTAAHDGNRARLRNRGLAAALGTYVAFLDSDDFWVPTKLERQIADLRAKGRRWGYGHHRWVDDMGKPLPVPGGREWRRCEGWILRDVLAVDAWIAMPTVIVERSLMNEIGGFDETFASAHDYEAWVRLAARVEAALIPEPLAAVRLHAGNVPHHSTIQSHEQLARIYRRLLDDPAYRPHWRLCRERYAAASRGLAARYRVAGRHARALRTAAAAIARAPWSRDGWVELAKALIAPLVPRAVLDIYHRARAHG